MALYGCEAWTGEEERIEYRLSKCGAIENYNNNNHRFSRHNHKFKKRYAYLYN